MNSPAEQVRESVLAYHGHHVVAGRIVAVLILLAAAVAVLAIAQVTRPGR